MNNFMMFNYRDQKTKFSVFLMSKLQNLNDLNDYFIIMYNENKSI